MKANLVGSPNDKFKLSHGQAILLKAIPLINEACFCFIGSIIGHWFLLKSSYNPKTSSVNRKQSFAPFPGFVANTSVSCGPMRSEQPWPVPLSLPIHPLGCKRTSTQVSTWAIFSNQEINCNQFREFPWVILVTDLRKICEHLWKYLLWGCTLFLSPLTTAKYRRQLWSFWQNFAASNTGREITKSPSLALHFLKNSSCKNSMDCGRHPIVQWSSKRMMMNEVDNQGYLSVFK